MGLVVFQSVLTKYEAKLQGNVNNNFAIDANSVIYIERSQSGWTEICAVKGTEVVRKLTTESLQDVVFKINNAKNTSK